MKSSSRDKIEGAAREAKGRIKEEAGHQLNDPDMEARGAGETLGGKAQRKVGDIKKVFNR